MYRFPPLICIYRMVNCFCIGMRNGAWFLLLCNSCMLIRFIAERRQFSRIKQHIADFHSSYWTIGSWLSPFSFSQLLFKFIRKPALGLSTWILDIRMFKTSFPFIRVCLFRGLSSLFAVLSSLSCSIIELLEFSGLAG